MMETKAVGAQIAALRKAKGLTQNDLGNRLGVSFQAVSKWERGETLPDTAILLDLANVLGTSVDYILAGGNQVIHYRGKFTASQMRDGILALKQMGELLGRDNMLYTHAIGGINEKMNTNVEDAFSNEQILECFIAEAMIQNLMAGKYIDPTDVKNCFRYDHYCNIVLDYCERYGIK